jgi:hypothetical protein
MGGEKCREGVLSWYNYRAASAAKQRRQFPQDLLPRIKSEIALRGDLPWALGWPASHLKIETQAKKCTNQGTIYREARAL